MSSPGPFPPLGLGVAGAALAGAAVVQLFPSLPGAAAIGVLALLAVVMCSRSDLFRIGGAFLLGIAWTCAVAGWRLQDRLPAALAGHDLEVAGRVLDLPLRDDDAWRFDFRVEEGKGAAATLDGARLRLAWYGPAPRALEPGSRWRLQVRLRPVRGVLNPGSRDAERQAFAQGLAALGYVRNPGGAQALAPGRGVDAARDRISSAIDHVLPGERGRFVRALAVGDTRALDPDDWEVLRATGLTHQIAISGFHVGLAGALGALLARLAWWCLPMLGRVLPRPQAAAIGALAFAAGYTALAGFALPTVRTLLMISVLMAARLSRRVPAGRAGFALALVAVLAVDPLAVLSPGFWLSFAGVGWLMWCLPPSSGASVADSGRLFVRAQWVALLGLLPLTVWFFGQASLPGPLANLFGVPVISLVVVPLALAGVVAWPAFPVLAGSAWQASAAVMDRTWQLLEAVAAWPAALAWLPEPSLLVMGLALVGALWCLMPRGTPDRALAAPLFVPLLWPAPDVPAQGEMDVHVLDVGQGLAVLVSTRSHRLLYDAGAAGGRGPDRGETVVVPALRALAVDRLDTVFISHASRDHAGGLGAVERAWPGVRVLGPEGWARPGMGLCEHGQRWRWDGVDFEILHPPRYFPQLGRENSCVLRIAAGGRVVLLPGDIGEHVESSLVAQEGARLDADLVVVPRHGAHGASSAGFIAATSPRWAVFSTGAGNRAGLPKAAVVDAWMRAGALPLDTAHTGSLHFRVGPAGSRLLGARREALPRYWREPPGPRSGYATGQSTADR